MTQLLKSQTMLKMNLFMFVTSNVENAAIQPTELTVFSRISFQVDTYLIVVPWG